MFVFSFTRQESYSSRKKKKKEEEIKNAGTACGEDDVSFSICLINLPWKVLLMLFLRNFLCYSATFSPPDRRPRTKNKSDPVVFSGGTIMMVLLWPGSWVFMKRFNCTLPASPDQVSTVPPTESPCRPSCLAKHSWLNVRHEPSCQEKAGGGAAGLRRPQFGISLLFVIHTEKNESRCRSGGERERGEEGREAIIKDERSLRQ